MDVGAQCEAWDNGRFKDACENSAQVPGQGNGWCAQRWCWVDPCNCDLPEPAIKSESFHYGKSQGRPMYYSYATCGSEDLGFVKDTESVSDPCFERETAESCTQVDECS